MKNRELTLELINEMNSIRSLIRLYINKYMAWRFPDAYEMEIDRWSIGEHFLDIEWYDNLIDSDEETCVNTKEFLEWCKNNPL